ncbi:MAG: response regulator [Thermoguttaceae bacterium]|nr:response regulator [Thermoguttaceae bacterium]MDW8079930.1 response regulator [Thermoguttaceae bacterium]
MKGRILLCDDEVTILRAAAFKLARAGFIVEEAYDGEEAWSKIVVNPPDVLITDYQMPRLTGLELIARLRSQPQFSEIAIVLLTAKGFELPCKELCAKWAIHRIVDKPFSPRELLQIVEAIFAERPKPAIAAV